MKGVPVVNNDYKAEWDAETLAEGETIKKDPARLARAEVAATKLADKETEKASAMRKVAGKRPVRPNHQQRVGVINSGRMGNPVSVVMGPPRNVSNLNVFQDISKGST